VGEKRFMRGNIYIELPGYTSQRCLPPSRIVLRFSYQTKNVCISVKQSVRFY